MVRKYPYYNRWSNYLFYAIICVLVEISIITIFSNSDLNEDFKNIIIFLTLHFSSMIFTASIILSYVHYKSPNYDIIIDSEMIVIPKNTVIPDSYFVHFSDILFINDFQNVKDEIVKIIANGSVVEIHKKLLKKKSDFDEIKYYLKEEVI